MGESTPQIVMVMTVATAARKLGVTGQTIYRWLSEGKLERYAAVEGDAVLVVAESVEAMLEEARKS